MSKRGERGYSPAWRTGTTFYLPPLIKMLMKEHVFSKRKAEKAVNGVFH